MLNIISDELERGWQAINEGKPEEALQIVYKIEKNRDLSPIDKLKCEILKGTGLVYTGKFESALNIGKYVEEEGKKLGAPFISIEAIVLVKFSALFLLGRSFEVLNDIESAEKLLKSVSQGSSFEIEQAEALLHHLKGYYSLWEGKYDHTLKYLKKCLPFFEQSTRLYIVVPFILNVMGAAYTLKGELDQGLKCLMRSLEVSNETYLNKRNDAGSYNWIGSIYHQQGKFDLAVDHFEKSLKIWKQFNDPVSIIFIYTVYGNLIKVFLDKNAHENAQDYLRKFKLFLEKYNLPLDRNYKLSQARILKSSPRTRDRAEAEKILKEIIMAFDALKESGAYPLPEENTAPIIELCDLYIKELYSTQNLDILDDIQPLITRLIKAAEASNHPSLVAHTNLLQGEISSLQMNMGDARRYLTKAQDVAEEHGLQLLASSISKEHDKLIEQLHKLENDKVIDMSLSDRLNLTSLEEIIARMQGKSAVKATELLNEDPVLLLIITEGGVPIFSYPFTDEWNQEDELFASFMSAIKSFSSEFFSEGLERIKFGLYTVLMKSMGEISSCYLFKGQTYLAKQKLTRFTENIQNNAPIMQTLKKYYQSGQNFELKDFPFLEVYIKDIFISKLQ